VNGTPTGASATPKSITESERASLTGRFADVVQW
jgi:hypothetical protein